METRTAALAAEVTRRYGVAPERVGLVRSPYRVCPLGAHIDHQLGRVTAMALDRAVWLAFAPTDEARVRLGSRSFAGEVDFALDPPGDGPEGDWGDFARGAVRALRRSGHEIRQGLVGVTDGSLAEGGLSSSAAVGVAYLLALEAVNGLEVSAWDNVRLDQAIENGYLGLRNGILDPAAILLARCGRLTVVDCARMTHETVRPGPGMTPHRILIAFSGLRQALVSTDYNRRVDECREAAAALLAAAGRPETRPLLGAVRAEEYETHHPLLTGAAARRAAHFFGEMARVAQGIEAWRRGDMASFGRLMSASGHSSIHLYECGAPPLIDLYEILTDAPGVYGARFSGAGFRGCCVALVAADAAEAAADAVARRYAAAHPDLARQAPVLVCDSGPAAQVLPARIAPG